MASIEMNEEELNQHVEEFRQLYEPAKHWEARKTFLLNNWGDYPERQLVSLSRVWANMEFDGCQYEPELMERVRELGAGVEVKEVQITSTKSSGRGSHQSSSSSAAAWRGGQQSSAAGFDGQHQSSSAAGFDGQQQSSAAGFDGQQQTPAAATGGQYSGFGFESNTFQQASPQTSITSTQGNGLLGAVPTGFPQQQVGGISGIIPDLKQNMQASSSGRSDGNRSSNKMRNRGPGEDDKSEEMYRVKQFAHRLEFLLKRPNIPLNQPWNSLNNAALKMGLKLEIENSPEFEEVEEDGELLTKRCNWLISCFLGGDMMLIQHRGVKWAHQKDSRNKAGEELINRMMNPRTLSIAYGEKTTPQGRKYTSEVVCSPLPWLKDELRDYKEVFGGKKNLKRHADEPETAVAAYDPNDPFSTFILLDTNSNVPADMASLQTLNNSAQNPSNRGCKLEIIVSDTKLPVNGEDVWLAKVLLNDTLIGFGTHEDQKKVKHVAAKVAVECLRKKCPVVKNNRSYDVDQKSAIPLQNFVRDGVGAAPLFDLPSSSTKAIQSDNMGHKLLKQMGWTGHGGLGKDGHGISQPIIPIERIRGEGLGYSEQGINREAITRIMEDYIASGSQEPLVFPSCLNRDERKHIHGVAHKLNLKSQSYGPKKGEDRYLLITVKRNLRQVVMDGARSGKSIMGYEVNLPDYK